MTRVVGIYGKKGAGKDTLAKLVKEMVGPTCHIVHFADRLKEGCLRVFPFLTEEDLNDPVLKETSLAAPLALDRFLRDMSDEFGLELRPAACVATTPRGVLQFVGTEYVRAACPTYWTDKVVVPLGATVLMVPDVRFRNECARVRELGGANVELVRKDVERADQHVSEAGIPHTEIDVRIEVKTGDFTKHALFGQCVKYSLSYSLGGFIYVVKDLLHTECADYAT
jgi:hypothetical protein